MESWVSTGLAEASNFLLANLRARIRHEIENGWSLFVADDSGTIAAMLALHLPEKYLDQLFVAPEYQGQVARPAVACLHANAIAGRNLAALRARKRKGLALVRARRFCVREGRDRASNGFMMKYYRWRRPRLTG